ncbi:YpjP family protein [Oceanobacillus chungangensis]|uniref:Cell division protein FtsK n=1 Tax=Oceanobacillus chungangensis TaxID=1229152 RepID=A0A3D8PKK2_9BACI|nr:YpjP family protein [Oceanobacillus chungangensis]RDW16626.1 hypothetical protein CWR45_13390 [Oceanobacillus chungangensis]
MKLWMRKILVALVTVATLGIYVPTELLQVDAEESKDSVASKAEEAVSTSTAEVREEAEVDSWLNKDNPYDRDYYIHSLIEKAKDQTITKFGPRIADHVEDDFTAFILPNIEMALQSIMQDADEDVSRYYAITEQPTKGYGEKIFHVYDHLNEQDVARFHVRRDNRPLDGYYFNFHYHLSKDGFKEHHEIGEIFWDKNTPPKWMA